MEIEVPEIFVVSDCLKCQMRHAPVRDCPTKDEKKIYLDVVYENNDIILSAFPVDVVGFLLDTDESIRNFYWIVRGETGQGYTCEDYLKWMRAI
jgi:hypothetical protein